MMSLSLPMANRQWYKRDMGYALKLFGKRLKQLREERNLNGAELAERIGVHRTAIYKMESADSGPSFDLIVRLAVALEVDEIDLLCTPEAHPRHELVELTRSASLGALRRTKAFLQQAIAEEKQAQEKEHRESAGRRK